MSRNPFDRRRLLVNLRSLGIDVDRLPEAPEVLAEYIAALTPEDFERIRQDVKELERIGLVGAG
jgi:hypothetical protein